MLRLLCEQYRGARDSGLGPAGSPANWRCLALEKRRGVKLRDAGWRTALNHAHPCSGMAEADIDAAAPPEREPQQGHGASGPSSSLARMALSGAIEVG